MNPYHEALRALDRHDYPRAMAELEKALRIDSCDADAYARRGWLHWHWGENGQALADVERALALDPDHAVASACRHSWAADPAPAIADPVLLEAVGADDWQLVADEVPALAPDASVSPTVEISPDWTITERSLSQSAWVRSSLFVRSSLTSMLVHMGLVTALGAFLVARPMLDASPKLWVTLVPTPPQLTAFGGGETSSAARNSAETRTGGAGASDSVVVVEPGERELALSIALGPTVDIDRTRSPRMEDPQVDLLGEAHLEEPTELMQVRTVEYRREAVRRRGGTPASEAAVEKALEWLAHHQSYDGGWSFDHRYGGDCRGACRDPGSLAEVRIGATAMALLPFLGAGQTHLPDKYGDNAKFQPQVRAGLQFIIQHMQRRGLFDGALVDARGRMYDHALATIALCEAYAMTHDRELVEPASRALAFIVRAQDPVGGGWRYQPRQPGDMSASAWHIMALKSGHMAYLPVPAATVARAKGFLNFVQFDDGANYGYLDPLRGTEATQAVGLLCRMYLGANRESKALSRGVAQLSSRGPSTSNMYFNYYATQVLHHFEGPYWTKWNEAMREYLIRAQSDEGHEAGSWFISGDHGSITGGRLYCTSLAAMTLEVYYRHMPLYGKRAADADFGR